MSNIGVIIARFQSPYLHAGHKALIKNVQERHKKIVLVLGVSPVLGSKRNPLDFHTREQMIKHEYPEVVVLPLSDHPLDPVWSINLDNLLQQTFPGNSFTLYGSRGSFATSYSGNLPVTELPENGSHSATLIRQQISEQVLNSIEFRTGVIYAYSNMYDKVYPTVDIALFRNNRTEILLGKKDIDNKWRLMGGFADPTDNSFEESAARELREECGPVETTAMQYETSFRVNDWRYRNEADKIITTLFSAEFISGSPEGSDDIAQVKWFTLHELQQLIKTQDAAAEHTPQFNHLLSKYAK